ncbi:MAG: SDR family NAD(P)-dependent oxidoreductase [Burkholderiaceae bacterium]
MSKTPCATSPVTGEAIAPTAIASTAARDPAVREPIGHAPEDIALWFQVQQFLTREAPPAGRQSLHRLARVVHRRCTYWLPVTGNQVMPDLDKATHPFGDLAHFEETKATLSARVKRLRTGLAWAESPPSRTRHLVSNIELERIVAPAGRRDELLVRSAFILYRTHMEPTRTSWAVVAPMSYACKTAGFASPIARSARPGLLLAKNLAVFFWETRCRNCPTCCAWTDAGDRHRRGDGLGAGRSQPRCWPGRAPRSPSWTATEAAARTHADALTGQRLTASAHVSDVTDQRGIEQAVAAARQAHGPVRIVTNCAGIVSSPGMPYTNNTGEDFDKTMAVNVRGMFQVAKACHADLVARNGGRLVNLSSITGMISAAYMPAYSVAPGRRHLADQGAGPRPRPAPGDRQCRLPGVHLDAAALGTAGQGDGAGRGSRIRTPMPARCSTGVSSPMCRCAGRKPPKTSRHSSVSCARMRPPTSPGR